MTTTFQPRGRLPVAGPSPRERRGERVRGAAAVLGTLLVVVGVPLALVTFIGNPLPTSLPSRDWLTAEITIDVILDVVALVVWAVWAHFVVCLLVELRAARSGSGLPSSVPFGGGNQFVARKLVAAALLLAGAATLAPQAGSQAPEPQAGVSATAEAAWGARYQAQAVQIAHQQAAAEQAAVASAGDASLAEASPAAEVYYTVQPPNGRNHDTLWDIADRTLGDPFRYKEVHQLNLDRVQPDGRKLVDADLIYPGWVLLMPADASGPGLTVVEPVAPPVAPPAAQPVSAPIEHTGSGSALAAPTSPRAAEHASTAAHVSADGAEDTGAAGTDTGRLALGGGLLAAGVLLALSGRRGPYQPVTEEEERLRLATDTPTAGLLDRALRHLAAGRAGQGQALPEAVLAYAGADRVVLHLAGAADSPALQNPPAPWRLGENGRSWSVAAEDVADKATPDVAAPYPALVNVASTHGFELLVDLEAAPGLVSVGGDDATAREVVVSMAAELATNVWSDGVQVTLVGFGDDLVEIAPDHLEQADDLAAVLDDVERTTRLADELSRSLGIDGVLAGRLSRAADRFRPRVLVLSAPPTQAEATRLQQLLNRGRTPLAAICVGDSVAARWRFTVDSSGSIDLGPLGVSGTARTLAPEQYRAITTLLRDLDQGRAERSAQVAAMTPAAGLAERASDSAAPAPRAGDLTGSAPVQIRLLGPVEVSAPGGLDERQRPLLVSFVVAVALADDGLHDAVLRATVWPRGVTDEIVATTATSVSGWLGRAADGRPRLRQDDDGTWLLSDDVACDFDALRHVAAGDPGDLDGQLAVLGLGRGEAFSSATGERFGSFAFARAAQQARVLVTTLARQAAASAVSSGRRDLAEQALRRGLAVVPTAEPLWRDLLRLLGPEGAPATAEEMYGALARHRVRPEPETDALVEQLDPGSTRRMA